MVIMVRNGENYAIMAIECVLYLQRIRFPLHNSTNATQIRRQTSVSAYMSASDLYLSAITKTPWHV